MRPGSGATAWTSGTPSTATPAARPAVMPAWESSITTHSPGSTPSAAIACRYGAGSGLRAGTSSPHTVMSKGSTPRPSRIDRSTMSASARGVVVTRAVASPAARTLRSSSGAPGRQATPRAISSAARASTQAASAAQLGLGPADAEVGVQDRPSPPACSCRPCRPGLVGHPAAEPRGELEHRLAPQLLGLHERAVHVEQDRPQAGRCRSGPVLRSRPVVAIPSTVGTVRRPAPSLGQRVVYGPVVSGW